jgi:general L-amino acid transport system permease protein
MKDKIPFWRDTRFFRFVAQVALILILALIFLFLINNLVHNFRRLGLSFGFDFLNRSSSFDIGDTAISFQPSDPYRVAIMVGLLNSLRVMIGGIILATIIGVTVGISRLSDNWLVRKIATIYVEIFRNTPLLLQLFFWYFAVFLKLPSLSNPLIVANSIFLSKRGMDLPFPVGTMQTWIALGLLILSLLAAIFIWQKRTQVMIQGASSERLKWLLIGMIVAVFLILIFGFDWQFPHLDRQENTIQGGLNLSPEFATLLLGLTVYTAAFIAEVVRAGIQSVSQGQWEAASALGLKPNLVMQLVIFPQALRLMIPPLTSEYLNLAKNSSLALAIGYNDVYAISNTISNQTGRSIEMLIVVMVTYLSINLIISLIMNRFNQSVQLINQKTQR